MSDIPRPFKQAPPEYREREKTDEATAQGGAFSRHFAGIGGADTKERDHADH